MALMKSSFILVSWIAVESHSGLTKSGFCFKSVNILGFVGQMVSIITIQPYQCSGKSVGDRVEMDGLGAHYSSPGRKWCQVSWRGSGVVEK